MAVKKKKQIIQPDVLPAGIDFQWLAQKDAEAKNPGGVWVDGYYIPPGLDFSGFGAPAANNPTAPVTPINPTPTAAPAVPAPPQKTPEELRAEAMARANAEVGTNADFLAAQAALYSKLGAQENQYSVAEQQAGTEYEMNRLGNERNRGLSVTRSNENLADRGLMFGGVADKAATDVHETYNLNDLNLKTRKTNTLAQILQARATARADYEQQLQAQRAGVTQNLVQRYLTGAGNAFK